MNDVQKRKLFESLVNSWAADVFRYAFWLCGDKEVAEELTQETFLRAWKYLEQLKEKQLAKSWLLTIVKREHARRYQGDNLVQENNFDIETIPSKAEYNMTTEAFVLRRALARFPNKYREPLILQIIGGYSIKEIAQQLSLSESTVTTRIYRARQKLRGILQSTED